MTARRGGNDQCVITWELEGQLGKNRLIPGSVMQDPTTFLQVGSHKDLARYVMAALRQLGLQLVRIGAGDWWSGNAQWDAWKMDSEKFYGILDNWADAALAEGMQIIFTCLGFADGSYHKENEPLWDTSSQQHHDANTYVGSVAKHFKGHAGVYAIEWGNETDHDLIAYDYWHRLYPEEVAKDASGKVTDTMVGYRKRLDAYCAFVESAIDGSTAVAGDGAPPVIMGHALIGAMFCVTAYHWDAVNQYHVVDGWDFVRGDRAFLKRPNDYQKIPSAHIYWFGAKKADFKSDMAASFAAYCNARGVTGLVGEYGDLRTSAAWYVKDVEDAFLELGLDSCAMRLAPRSGFPLTSLPTPSPAPVETPVETPAPVADPVPEPSDSSSPTQETTEEERTEQPSEGEQPAVEEPEDGEAGEETPEAEEPANEAPSEPDPPAASEPEEEDERPSNPSPETVPEPETHIGRGFVFWRVVEWILGLWGKITKR
ncbi:MAG: hypothetical protein LLG45_13270 [Actinomycetia bacterium]|nr:hypothetical protein [Actinomycetes bacterium]